MPYGAAELPGVDRLVVSGGGVVAVEPCRHRLVADHHGGVLALGQEGGQAVGVVRVAVGVDDQTRRQSFVSQPVENGVRLVAWIDDDDIAAGHGGEHVAVLLEHADHQAPHTDP